MNSERGRPNIPRRRITKIGGRSVISNDTMFCLLALGILKLDNFAAESTIPIPNMAFLFKTVEIMERHGYRQRAFDGSSVYFIKEKAQFHDSEHPWFLAETESRDSYLRLFFFKKAKGVGGEYFVGSRGLHTRLSHLPMLSNTHRDGFEKNAYIFETTSVKFDLPKYVCKDAAAYKMDAAGIKMLLEDLGTTLAFCENCEAEGYYPL